MNQEGNQVVPIGGAIRTPNEFRHHILSVLVENKTGVLARVAQLFSRRGYNIFSLAVAPTDDERFSRITVVVDVETAPLEQITKQLHKLVNVIKISEIDPDEAVEYELLLATVSADAATRAQVIELVNLFEGRIVDVGLTKLTVMVAASPSQLDDFEALIVEYGLVELQRTGRVALQKLGKPVVKRKQLKGRVS
ncbi:acetolactate synthase, small subunit [Ferrithrix thermotolerans DSM 19514]|uniref:Acetolactate synthase small subunit n=1 Tax=Ferrithrix thermotolerans DSM 19514 TaxID=1121881 RepID=A0A1M4VFA8_9ACTN|nr:acetolactate synthase small subunit [Ferrithrix thermotolerans]SHE67641.1 acetolactate synthase, small subunit [Ferrithrix thermotolerans DSM 19514]